MLPPVPSSGTNDALLPRSLDTLCTPHYTEEPLLGEGNGGTTGASHWWEAGCADNAEAPRAGPGTLSAQGPWGPCKNHDVEQVTRPPGVSIFSGGRRERSHLPPWGAQQGTGEEGRPAQSLESKREKRGNCGTTVVQTKGWPGMCNWVRAEGPGGQGSGMRRVRLAA